MELTTGESGGGDRFAGEPTARELYGVLKKMWLAEEQTRRAASQERRGMLCDVGAWQEWLVDPADVPPFVQGAAQAVADYSFAKMHVKTTPEPITTVLTYRRGAIVSVAMLKHQRIWICPITTRPRPEDWAIKCGTPQDRFRRGLVGLVRTISSDLTLDPVIRELVAYQDDMIPSHRPKLRNGILSILRNLWADPDAPPAGTLILDEENSPAYIIGSCRFFGSDTSRNVVIACDIVDGRETQDEAEETLFAAGFARLRQPAVPEHETSLVATIMLRPIVRQKISRIIGSANDSLDMIRRMLERNVSEP